MNAIQLAPLFQVTQINRETRKNIAAFLGVALQRHAGRAPERPEGNHPLIDNGFHVYQRRLGGWIYKIDARNAQKGESSGKTIRCSPRRQPRAEERHRARKIGDRKLPDGPAWWRAKPRYAAEVVWDKQA